MAINDKTQYFSSEEEANAWLEANGFQPDAVQNTGRFAPKGWYSPGQMQAASDAGGWNSSEGLGGLVSWDSFLPVAAVAMMPMIASAVGASSAGELFGGGASSAVDAASGGASAFPVAAPELGASALGSAGGAAGAQILPTTTVTGAAGGGGLGSLATSLGVGTGAVGGAAESYGSDGGINAAPGAAAPAQGAGGGGSLWDQVTNFFGGGQTAENPALYASADGGPSNMAAMAAGGGGSAAGGASSFGSIGSLLSGNAGASDYLRLASSLYGLYSGNQYNQAAQKLASQADPFAQYRGQYGDMLSKLMADPSSMTQLPGYEAGLQTVQRSLAQQGLTGGGRAMTELQKYGGDFFNQQVTQLAGLAGAGSIGGGGNLALSGIQGQSQTTSAVLNSLANMFSNRGAFSG